MITVDDLSSCLPANIKSAATQSLADKINTLTSDPESSEQITRNFVSFTSVLQDGRYKVEDYMNAVHYVSYKLMGNSNKDAYAKTFPIRYQRLMANGTSEKAISAYVAGFNKGKLVAAIMEQAAIPIWILNQAVLQQAINRQAHLMIHAESEKVQTEAANSIMTHVKRPETKQVEINVGFQESDGMKEMKNLLGQLAEKQIELIQQGTKTQKIAHHKMGEMIDVTPVEEPEKIKK